MSKPRSKPGKYGTLYYYAIRYRSDCEGDDYWHGTVHYWEYSGWAAVERFLESLDGEGWIPYEWCQLTDGPAHRQTWHPA